MNGEIPKNKKEFISPFLFATVINYLAKLYCICVVWQSADIDQISNIIVPINDDTNETWKFNNNLMTTIAMDQRNHYQLVWLKYTSDSNNNNTNIDDVIELGINTGCQVSLLAQKVTVSLRFSAISMHCTGGKKREKKKKKIIMSSRNNRSQRYDVEYFAIFQCYASIVLLCYV